MPTTRKIKSYPLEVVNGLRDLSRNQDLILKSMARSLRANKYNNTSLRVHKDAYRAMERQKQQLLKRLR
jgi:flagellar biosynthesis/type III secretory pathway protein FliH